MAKRKDGLFPFTPLSATEKALARKARCFHPDIWGTKAKGL